MALPVTGLIRYFVERAPGAGRTRIVKFLYMADHEARRYLGRPLTDLDYHWDNFGPFDSRILDEIGHLTKEGYIEDESLHHQDWGYRYRPTPRSLPIALTKEEEAILESVVQSYA